MKKTRVILALLVLLCLPLQVFCRIDYQDSSVNNFDDFGRFRTNKGTDNNRNYLLGNDDQRSEEWDYP